MGKVIQLKPSVNRKADIYAKALKSRSDRNGVNYSALYSGNPTDREAAKESLARLHRKQSLESWSVEG